MTPAETLHLNDYLHATFEKTIPCYVLVSGLAIGGIDRLSASSPILFLS